ncbi:M23 family metallopeptidase [Kitasatospora sp. NPDC002227]|uniref:M23 family metallopeptidase n=1 Tax=Kitasatospora sp. NPDC002227 TaxID=3154773 RepID=UPI0033281C9A
MASTHSPVAPGPADHLLDELVMPTADEGARHRMPRQARVGGPLIGVTAMAASLGATGFAAAATAPTAPVTTPDEAPVTADPGLALAARIQQQADGSRTAAEETRLAAAQEAEAKRAATQAETQQAPAPAATPAPAEQPVADGFALPVSGYALTAHYGQSGSYWSQLHTGLDFAAPTGTPVVAVAAGTVSSAGWSGAYGYRVIQTLPDGTELWYCHLSAITVASGPIAPGTQLGRVGATGNPPGPRPGAAPAAPHLHLEVRPAGAAPVDPLPWLQAHGLQP